MVSKVQHPYLPINGSYLNAKKYPFWYERYKFYQSKVRMLISKSKRNHLRAFFQENLNNSKKLWNKINELINKNQKGMDDIFLKENGATITKQRIVVKQVQ